MAWREYGDPQGGGNPETQDKVRQDPEGRSRGRAVNPGSPTGLVTLGRDPLDKPRPFLGAPGLGLPLSFCSELSPGESPLVCLQVALGKTHCSPRPCLPGGLLFPWTPSWDLCP